MGAGAEMLSLGASFLLGASAALAARDHLPANSAISFEQLLEFAGGDLPPTIELPELAVGERRRLALPDYYYDKCVFWVNAMRSREGLPALQRWRDFEDCTDRGAKFDAKIGIYHESIKRGIACDFQNYQPVTQNTCPNWHHGSDTFETCATAMWREKDLLEVKGGELRCKNGKPAKDCAGHYLNLRGGAKGYNAYDRVACGFYISGKGIWINQNFGSGKKTDVDRLERPELFQPYGYACGGDVHTRPASLLEGDKECLALKNEMQYNDCRNEYRQDYRFHACYAPKCDPAFKGPCMDYTVNRHGHMKSDGSGHDICTDKMEWPCDKPYAVNWPVGSRVWHKPRDVCRKTCQQCACTRKPFQFGFTEVAPDTDEEIPSAPEDGLAIDGGLEAGENEDLTALEPPADGPFDEIEASDDEGISEPISDTLDDKAFVSDPESEEGEEEFVPEATPAPVDANCSVFSNRKSCVKISGCQWTRGRLCAPFDGICAGLKRGACTKSGGCLWDNDSRPRGCKKESVAEV